MWSLLLLFFSCSVAELQCPPGYSIFSSSKCFSYSPTATSIIDAQRRCVSSGGILASISNSFENSFVSSLGNAGQKGFFTAWIGLTRTLPDQQFHWMDGSSSFYTNYASTETYNVSNTYMIIDIRSGQWHSYSDPVGYTLPFFCSAVPQDFGPVPTASSTGTCDSGWTWFGQTNKCYKTFYNENWYEAESVCRSSKAHLTSIHSLEENDFVASLSQSGLAQPQEHQVWLGVTKVSRNWTNVDGTPVDYYNWGLGISDSGVDNCVQIFADQLEGRLSFETTWNAWDCEVAQRAFVCKKDVQ